MLKKNNRGIKFYNQGSQADGIMYITLTKNGHLISRFGKKHYFR